MMIHNQVQPYANNTKGRPGALPTLLTAALLVLLVTLLSPATARADTPLPDASIELHTHLFMKPGLGWLFSGGFDEPLAADDWSDRLSCKANAATLDRSGIGIAVVALFAHPLYVGDMRASIRAQIEAARRFCANHPAWELARNPQQVRQIVRSGKRAMVLSLEGASGILESEEDLIEFIDEAGIAIVTPLHLVDDRYGGVATMNGYQRLANPLGLVDGLLDPHCASGVERNPRGLTPLGRRLIAELIARGVWIDLTHASDRAIDDMLPLLRRARQPLLFTHTSPRQHRHAERALSAQLLAEVARSHGVIGLLPSEDAFEHTTVARRFCPASCALEACQGSVHALAQIYTELSRVTGAEALVLGSDYNGGMRHLASACGTSTSLDGEPGLWNISQQDEVWRALRMLGAPVPPLRRTLARFLASWSRVARVPASKTLGAMADEPRPPRLPQRQAVTGPGVELAVSFGGGALLGGGALQSGGTGQDGRATLSIGAEMRVLKDMARAHPGEPVLYFTHLRALAASAPFSDDLEYVRAYVAPVGASAQWYDSAIGGDLLSARLHRNSALDQSLIVQWLALRGHVRTMPGLLKKPGHYNLFLGLGAGVLGYKYIDRQSTEQPLHAFVPVEGSAELGASVWPATAFRITLLGKAQADVALTDTSPLSYQSDVALTAGMTMGIPQSVIEPYLDMSWLWTRYGGMGAPWLRTRLLQAGARVPF